MQAMQSTPPSSDSRASKPVRKAGTAKTTGQSKGPTIRSPLRARGAGNVIQGCERNFGLSSPRAGSASPDSIAFPTGCPVRLRGAGLTRRQRQLQQQPAGTEAAIMPVHGAGAAANAADAPGGRSSSDTDSEPLLTGQLSAAARAQAASAAVVAARRAERAESQANAAALKRDTAASGMAQAEITYTADHTGSMQALNAVKSVASPGYLGTTSAPATQEDTVKPASRKLAGSRRRRRPAPVAAPLPKQQDSPEAAATLELAGGAASPAQAEPSQTLQACPADVAAIASNSHSPACASQAATGPPAAPSAADASADEPEADLNSSFAGFLLRSYSALAAADATTTACHTQSLGERDVDDKDHSQPGAKAKSLSSSGNPMRLAVQLVQRACAADDAAASSSGGAASAAATARVTAWLRSQLALLLALLLHLRPRLRNAAAAVSAPLAAVAEDASCVLQVHAAQAAATGGDMGAAVAQQALPQAALASLMQFCHERESKSV